MRLSISVAAGAALCVAAAASAGWPQTFETGLLGGFIQDGSEHSPYISQKYGKSFGYLDQLPSHLDRTYEPWQGTAASITNAEVRITIDLGPDGFDLPISFHVMFYTGSDESPVKQFELLQKTVVKTNSEGKYVFFKNTFTAAERTALASGAGTPLGTCFIEVFSSNSFSGKAKVELVPGPGGALAMTIFAMGGLARRRRAA